MNLILIILHVIACFLLIVVILIQGGRGQGLTGSNFSSGNVQGLFGTRAADFLTKATTVAAICFLFTCLGLDFVETQKSKSLMQVGKQSAPVDIEAVKKALEKIKAEADAKSKESTESKVKELASKTAETAENIQKAVAAEAAKAAADLAEKPASEKAPA